MYFNSFQEFIEMGGHAFYVWLCYGIVISVLIVYFVYSNKMAQTRQKDLIKFYQRMDSRSKALSQKERK
jgi:heme exporter protein D